MPSNHPRRPQQAEFTVGQRLHCRECGCEIEIINPSPRRPPDQVF